MELELYGNDLFGVSPRKLQGPMADKFLFPPFTVLRADAGDWQERKAGWLQLGIQSEVGRAENLLNFSKTVMQPDPEKRARGEMMSAGTSIFDPVLCEVAYRWFCPKGGQVLDPFCGGSVRGVVASKLGLSYWGCDLRQEQVDANNKQGAEICEQPPTWVCGDSTVMVAGAPEADFIFSCPPYGDLERYSDDPRDLSTMEYDQFVPAYNAIIERSLARLKNNRFACFVVGDFRDKRGFYRGFVIDTILAFRYAGAGLYNQAVLVTLAGTLPVRTQKNFPVTRKLGKAHQDVLLFCKGDPKEAVNYCKLREQP